MVDFFQNNIDNDIDRYIAQIVNRSHQLWEEYYIYDDKLSTYLGICIEDDVPNAWFKAACAYHHQPAFPYLSDTSLSESPNIPSTSLSIWQQHQKIIEYGVGQGLKAFEIMKNIPLNHPKWLAEFDSLFKDNQVNDLYSSIKIVSEVRNIELRAYGIALIREYISEIKVHQVVEQILSSK